MLFVSTIELTLSSNFQWPTTRQHPLSETEWACVDFHAFVLNTVMLIWVLKVDPDSFDKSIHFQNNLIS